MSYFFCVTVLEVIQRSTEFLSRKGVDSPRLQVELLLAHLLNMPRLKLYLNFERALSAAELDALRDSVKRRAGREPLQHILGSTSFCGLEIGVNCDVLVPRPETELLAERGWQFLKSLVVEAGSPPMALDFGTGSGCIAVALAVQAPSARVVAVDDSPPALTAARENATRLQVADRIEFLRGSSVDAPAPDLCFDLIISNPPYIPTDEIATLSPEVRDFDPRMALDGGEDGLQFYRMLASQAPPRLRSGGKVMVEFGDEQADAVRSIFENAGWRIESIENDLSGRPRILIAVLAER